MLGHARARPRSIARQRHGINVASEDPEQRNGDGDGRERRGDLPVRGVARRCSCCAGAKRRRPRTGGCGERSTPSRSSGRRDRSRARGPAPGRRWWTRRQRACRYRARGVRQARQRRRRARAHVTGDGRVLAEQLDEVLEDAAAHALDVDAVDEDSSRLSPNSRGAASTITSVNFCQRSVTT